MSAVVFHGARVHTMDPALGDVTALAVRGERIIAAGSPEQCRDAAGPGAEQVDLGGLTVVPGLTDSHIHTGQYARGLASVELFDTSSLEEALTRVRAHAATLPEGAWVMGGRWSHHRWARPVLPCAADLDGIDRPVLLASVDGHTAWANTIALRLAGIDRATPDPVGGEIVRDERGEATGILRESARDYVEQFADLHDDLPALLHAAIDRMLSHGLTGVHDIDGSDVRAAYAAMRAADELPIRVHKLLSAAELDDAITAGVATGDGDGYLSIGPVKLYTDGALGSHSCRMSEGLDGDFGIAVTPAAELRDAVRRATAAGIAVAAHAIGDAANHDLLDVFATDVAASGRLLRNRVEHAQYLQPADVHRFASLGVIASMQPIHCTSDIPLSDSLIPGRTLRYYGWRSLLDAGAHVTFGSDAPVEDPNPWLGIHAAVTRQRADGTPPGGWQPEQRLTVAEAIAGYTTAPAYASYQEQLRGMLRPGMYADFAVTTTDPFTADESELAAIQVVRTVVGGRTRFQA